MPTHPMNAEAPKVPDADLRSWISVGSQEPREVIVEAAVPTRTVALERRRGGPPVPSRLRGEGGGASRSEVLSELRTYLKTLLGIEPTLLSAAGALAIEASGEQVHRLLEHPLVKAIRPNRRLAAPKPRLASG